VGQELLAQVGDDLVRRRRRPGQGFVEQRRELVRPDLGKQRPVLDVLEVLADQVHHAAARVTELLDVHRTHLRLAVILARVLGITSGGIACLNRP
jgi:hypothetical protein